MQTLKDVIKFVNCTDDVASALAFLSLLPEKSLCDIESLSKYFYDLVTKYTTDITNYYRIILSTIPIIVLTSIKHAKPLLFNNKDNHENFLLQIISEILIIFRPNRAESVNLLKLLILINKNKNIFDKRKDLRKEVFTLAQKAATSPHIIIKSNATTLLENLAKKYNESFSVKILIKFPRLCNEDVCRIDLINEIIACLYNNIENRGACLIYEKIIQNYPFAKWKTNVFPIFFEHLQYVDNESEFFQSLLKYWIPINCKLYKSDFYLFIRNTKIDSILKPYVLLEAKKQDCFLDDFHNDTLNYLNDHQTHNLGLQIIAHFTKKSQTVTQLQIKSVQYFLINYSKTDFDSVALNCLKMFISQIFLTSTKQNYEEFMEFCYIFCYHRRDLPLAFELSQIVLKTAKDSFYTSYKLDDSRLINEKLINNDLWERTFQDAQLQDISKGNCSVATGLLDLEPFKDCLIANEILTIRYNQTNDIPVIVKCLNFLGTQLNDLENNLDNNKLKALKSLIMAVLEILLDSQNYWNQLDKKQTLHQLCMIIQKSNLKKPVTMSVQVLQKFSLYLGNDAEKLKFLAKVLNSLHTTPAELRLKIRRNPETRLVIHALCLTDNCDKPLVDWSLQYLLEVCENSTNTSTLSSALNCLEIFVSDNTIHNYTLKFIPQIMQICIDLFNIQNWSVRNSNLQLLKALIERFLGVSMGYNNRTKSVQDLFILFPKFLETFNNALKIEQLSDSAIVPLLFFSESKLKDDFYALEIESFRKIFLEIIGQYTNHYGNFAIGAYCSTVVERDVPKIFHSICEHIATNFDKLPRNVIVNYTQVLSEFSIIYPNNFEINQFTEKLIKTLQNHEHFYFNLISVKLDSVESILQKINLFNFKNLTYKERIFLNNNIPFIVSNLEISCLATILPKILLYQLPNFLQIKVLAILTDRLFYNCHNGNNDIVKCLIVKMLSLHDCEIFLTENYANVILLLFNKMKLDADFVKTIRKNYDTCNMYKIIIIILLLNYVDNKNVADVCFIRIALQHFVKNSVIDNKMYIISCSLMYLFNVCPKHNVSDLIKLAFLLLFNEKTSFEICKFISLITNTKCGTILFCINNLLSEEKLLNLIGDRKSILKLLLDLYQFVEDLPQDDNEAAPFYLIQSNYFTPKKWVLKIIQLSIRNFVNLS